MAVPIKRHEFDGEWNSALVAISSGLVGVRRPCTTLTEERPSLSASSRHYALDRRGHTRRAPSPAHRPTTRELSGEADFSLRSVNQTPSLPPLPCSYEGGRIRRVRGVLS